ncbi:phosphoribosylaminoimidazolesuccinocarboxamide synthase [bacterium]|nr:phosphoribosylaminoimidazolesuccinocarboxamide synthase [bacterium]
MATLAPLYQTDIPGYPVHRGKVRDVYDLGDRLMIVATDRLSAFDVVFPDPIPEKGRILTQLSTWWFHRTGALVPNHFITSDFAEFPDALQPYKDQLEGRSMIVKKARPLKGEFVVRGYLDGSSAKSYDETKQICGIEMLAGLKKRSPFGIPLFTPTTKAEEGHDLPIDFDGLCHLVTRPLAKQGRDYAIALYTYGHNYVFRHGLILSDTKFEFGLDENDELMLIDEVLTPDSSRYWLKETYQPDSPKAISLDKQYVRDYVEQIGWGKEPPAPRLPKEVIDGTTERYKKAYEMVTGKPLPEL